MLSKSCTAELHPKAPLFVSFLLLSSLLPSVLKQDLLLPRLTLNLLYK